MYRGIISIWGLCVLIACSVGFTEVYSIQMEANQTVDGAQSRMLYWQGEGYSPVFIKPEGAWNLVLFGEYSNMEDAYLDYLKVVQSGDSVGATLRVFDDPSLSGSPINISGAVTTEAVTLPARIDYSVQVGTFHEELYADLSKDRLSGYGYSPVFNIAKSGRFISYVGRFSSLASAIAYQGDLLSEGLVPNAIIGVLEGVGEVDNNIKPDWSQQATQPIQVLAQLDKNARPEQLAETYYTVQVGAYGSRRAAVSQKIELEAQGFEPVLIWHDVDAVHWRVGFGVFNTYSDALVYSTLAREVSVVEGAIVCEVPIGKKGNQIHRASEGVFDSNITPSIVPKTPFQSLLGFVERPYVPAPANSLSALQSPRMEKFTLLEEAKEIRESYRRNNGHGKLSGNKDKILSRKNAQAIHKLATEERKQGRLDQALELQLKLARTPVDTNSETRVIAAWDAASTLHEKRRRLDSLRAYRELEAVCKSQGDTEGVTRCRIEQVGLLLELAESGKGKMKDVRREARRLAASISDSTAGNRKRKCLLHLMAAESYAKEGDYDNAITQLSSFITAYEAHAIHRREVGAALVWLGIVYDQVGQEALALEQFERVLSVNYNEAERFGSEDFHKMASRWVMESHLQDGDTEGMKLFLEFLQEAYPHSPETRQAERIYKLFLFHHQNS